MSGLVVAGVQVDVPGVRVLNVTDDARAKLSPEDYKKRASRVVKKIVVHTTKGISPTKVFPGRGPEGRAFIVSNHWKGDPLRSAAQLVADGHLVLCLADLATICAHHATTANDDSIGLEMYQESNGGIYEGTLDNAVRIIRALCGLSFDDRFAHTIAIPYQIAGDRYVAGKIIERLKFGGDDFSGIFGHRDQAWMFPEYLDAVKRAKYPHGYAGRGAGDPGDDIGQRLIADGCEPFKLASREDLTAWMHRQRRLNMWGAKLAVDGLPGPATFAAMKKLRFAHGREIDAAVEDPRG